MSTDRMISILLPFYNEERYIAKCLQSIVNQTYTHWEVIAIDDQSTDGSPAIVEEFAKRDKRIKYLRNPVKGVTHALQFALHHSNGTLVSRMDGDDIKTEDNLDELQKMVPNPGILGTGKVNYFSDEPEGVKDGYKRYEEWMNAVMERDLCFEHIYKECTIPSPNWLVYRSDLFRAGAFRSIVRPEDYELTLRFYEAGLQVKTSKKVIHHWRDHGTRVTRNDSRYADNFFLDLKLPFFIRNEVSSGDTIILWGAGKKAKAVAQKLVDKSVPFRWISNNPNKTGHNIYGVILEDEIGYAPTPGDKIVIAISSPKDRKAIEQKLKNWGSRIGTDHFWFC